MGHHGLNVLIPVLRRPHRVAPLLDALEVTVPDARVVFITDPGDHGECAEIRRCRGGRRLRVEVLEHRGTYPQKINHAVRKVKGQFVFLGADDLNFKPGWFEAAQKALKSPVQVVGVNDLIDRDREHSPHFLMTREYARLSTIDGRPGPLHEGYRHWRVDDELIATAKNRGAYAYCPESVVEHLHPFAGKAKDDPVYAKGRRGRRRDMQTFARRERLWT